jgi:hypothetical protein
MPADERLIAAMRRFWTKQQVEDAYQQLFTADFSKVKKLTVIVSKSAEGDGASAQVVVTAEDRLTWLDAFEARLQELEAEESGKPSLIPGATMIDFSSRYTET